MKFILRIKKILSIKNDNEVTTVINILEVLGFRLTKMVRLVVRMTPSIVISTNPFLPSTLQNQRIVFYSFEL